MDEATKDAALEYHRQPPAGKISVTATKPLVSGRDLSLAYSPGVGAASLAIAQDPQQAHSLTARGNLVAVISNGTAVLGLGNVGPLAAKPVMEGKAVLFKKFAGIDGFDIEVNENDVERFCDIVAALEPTFGGINLEDIAAPHCFAIEERLRQRMKIPVFHDDQHGTAIIVAAAVLNSCLATHRDLAAVRLVACGAGAAGMACLNMLCSLGLPRQNIALFDRNGLVDHRRQFDQQYPESPIRNYARSDLPADYTLEKALHGADIFLGVSAASVLSPAMIMPMAENPIILALANPVPEIMPEDVKKARPDAIMATGRSDYPNQVNNVLCFPYIFRGALDVGATVINQEMKAAAVHAIAQLARREPDCQEYLVTHDDDDNDNGSDTRVLFGRGRMIPDPFDKRLITEIAPAVARAACRTGVATRPIEDWEAYARQLEVFVYRSGTVMKPVIAHAQARPRRVVYAEGESPVVLQGVQAVVDDRLATPILVGRPKVIAQRIKRLGLRLNLDSAQPGGVTVVNPESDPRFREYHEMYHQLHRRHGVTSLSARTIVRMNAVVIAGLMVRRQEADGILCGVEGGFIHHLRRLQSVVGLRDGVPSWSAMMMLVLPSGPLFIVDTHVTANPTVDEMVQSTILAVEWIQALNLEPRVAFLSASNFGSRPDVESSPRSAEAVARLQELFPHLAVEGEMHGDAALWPDLRQGLFPDGRLHGQANLLVMPNIEAANIAYNLIKAVTDAVPIGPILLGANLPAHVLTFATTPRTIYNMTALVVNQALGLLASPSKMATQPTCLANAGDTSDSGGAGGPVVL